MSLRESLAAKRRAALRAYFEARPRQLTAICRRAGVSPETVRAFIKGDSASLTQATYDRLAASENIPVAVLLGDDPGAARKYTQNSDSPVTKSSSASGYPGAHSEVTGVNYPDKSPPRAVRVTARVQAGIWREAPELPGDERYDVFVPVGSTYADLQLVGAEVIGNSMDLLYPAGTVLIFVNTIDLGEGWMPVPGNRVVARRVSREGLYETTVKEYAVDEAGRAWLVPRSSDPSLMPVPAEAPLTEDDEAVRIVGLVIGSYRPEQPVPRRLTSAK